MWFDYLLPSQEVVKLISRATDLAMNPACPTTCLCRNRGKKKESRPMGSSLVVNTSMLFTVRVG
jgi:hypothetical protein